MKKDQTKKAKPAIVITSLSQLQGLVDAPIMVRFKIDNQEIELPVRRATPVMLEKTRSILRAVQPPFNQVRKDYDPLDEKYLAARDLAQKTARSFVVYSCCEAVAKEKPALTSEKDIHTFVQGKLTDNILDMIEISALAGGLDVAREVQSRANFPYTPDSES